MKVTFLIRMTAVAVLVRQCTQEILPKSELISSGEYLLFVPIIPVYYIMDKNLCQNLRENSFIMSETPQDSDSIIAKLKNRNIHVNGEQVCELFGTLLLNKNVIKLLDREPCVFDQEYCYNNRDTKAFWDITQRFSYLRVFQGNLDLWQIEISQPAVKFQMFSHKTLNLTLRIEEELVVRNITILSTPVDDLFVQFIGNVTEGNDAIYTDISERYFGKLTNKTNYEKPLEENTTEGNCLRSQTANRSFIPSEEYFRGDSDGNLSIPIVVLLLISATGNCIGIVCMVMYCYKYEYFRKMNRHAYLEMETGSNCKIKNGTMLIQDNDLYNETNGV